MAPRSPPQTQIVFKVESSRFSRIGALLFVRSVDGIKPRLIIIDLNTKKREGAVRAAGGGDASLIEGRVSERAGRSTDGWMTASFRIKRAPVMDV